MAELLPLTPLQEGLLFHHQYGDGTDDLYISQLRVELTGPLDPARLRAAAAEVQRRHPALRATFRRTSQGTPVQVVLRAPRVDFTEAEVAGAGELDALCAADRRRGFDIATGPLMRWTLASHGDRHTLITTAHHSIRDGWSMPIVMRELMAHYLGEPLPQVRPHREHLTWLARQDRAAAHAAWGQALAGLDGGTLLATGPAPHEQEPGRLDLTVEGSTSRPPPAASASPPTPSSRRPGCCWWPGSPAGRRGHRHHRQRPSCRSAGRGRHGRSFVNTVPLRAALRADEPVGDLARRLQLDQARLVEHHHLGLVDIRRTAGHGELFDTSMVFENYPLDVAALAGGPPRRAPGRPGRAPRRHPLRARPEASPVADGLRLRLHHRPDVLSDERMGQIADLLPNLLRAVVTEPTTPVGRISGHTAASRVAPPRSAPARRTSPTRVPGPNSSSTRHAARPTPWRSAPASRPSPSEN
ncbi:condensation domain-containing protein [Streptomyces lydicus]|nr:condensation domain-containing protein [Streptomyces lydicus]